MAQKKAFVYIDGFNLFFSLKKNNWKKYYWLDVVELSSKILRPGHFISSVKYYTARIKKPKEKSERQKTYLSALYTRNFIKIKYGRYQQNVLVCKDCGRAIPVPKEKKTDVNIATEMIMDAITEKCDVQYLLSGDSDLVPPIQKIKEYQPKREIYLICTPKPIIFPVSENAIAKGYENNSNVNVSGELIKLCNGHQYIKESHLKDSQLPKKIVNFRNHQIIKPDYWE